MLWEPDVIRSWLFLFERSLIQFDIISLKSYTILFHFCIVVICYYTIYSIRRHAELIYTHVDSNTSNEYYKRKVVGGQIHAISLSRNLKNRTVMQTLVLP